MLRLSSRHVTYLLRAADDEDLPWPHGPEDGVAEKGELRECLGFFCMDVWGVYRVSGVSTFGWSKVVKVIHF